MLDSQIIVGGRRRTLLDIPYFWDTIWKAFERGDDDLARMTLRNVMAVEILGPMFGVRLKGARIGWRRWGNHTQ